MALYCASPPVVRQVARMVAELESEDLADVAKAFWDEFGRTVQELDQMRAKMTALQALQEDSGSSVAIPSATPA